MEYFRKTGLIFALSLLELASVYADDLVQDYALISPQEDLSKPNASSFMEVEFPAVIVKSGDKIENILEEYINSQSLLLISVSSHDQLAYGIAKIESSLDNESYILALESAYAIALNEAYGKVARVIGADSISKEVKHVIQSSMTKKSELMVDCEQKVENRQITSKPNGYVLAIINIISDFTGLSLSPSKVFLANQVIDCSELLDINQVTTIQKNIISNVVVGSRVVQSVISDQHIGVVVGYSPDIAQSIVIPINQNMTLNPLSTARSEIRDWVEQQINAQSGSKLGLLGSRMTRLSNGEWALIGFGVAPFFEFSKSGTTDVRQLNKSMRNQSNLSAQSELENFSSLISAYHARNEFRNSNIKMLEQELRVTRANVDSSSETIERVLSSQISVLSTALLNSELRGATNVHSKKMTDDNLGVSFYLSAYAWSPSLVITTNSVQVSAGID